MYGTTACPILVLFVVVVVFAVLSVLLLCSFKSLFAGVASGPMPWSSVVSLALLFWVIVAPVLLVPSWILSLPSPQLLLINLF